MEEEKEGRGPWEKALLRLAGAAKCYVRWNEGFAGSRVEDSSGSAVSEGGTRSYRAELAAFVPAGSKKALPMGLDLELWDRSSASYEPLVFEDSRNHWWNASDRAGVRTREEAAKNLLTAVSGSVMGFVDETSRHFSQITALQRFLPVFEVPSFSSPSELELKLAAMEGAT